METSSYSVFPDSFSVNRVIENPSQENGSPDALGSTPENEGLEIDVLTQIEEVETLLPEWSQLFLVMSRKRKGEPIPPFSHPNVLVEWAVNTPGEVESLFVVTLRSGEKRQLKAVFPGFRRGRKVRLLTDSVTDYQDITAFSQEAAIELMKKVIEISDERGFRLVFQKISDHSLLWNCLRAPNRPVSFVVKRIYGPCPYGDFQIPIGGDFLDSLSKKRRKNYKAACSKIRQGIPHGKLEHLRGKEITKEVIEAVANLHIENQHRKKGKSILAKPSVRNWLCGLTGMGSGLCVSLFWDGENLAAFNLSFIDEERKVFYYYIPAFSFEYAAYSPGTRLLVESMKYFTSSEGGNIRLDLLCGDEAYKRMWSSDCYFVWRVVRFPERVSCTPMYCLYRIGYALKALKNRFKKGVGCLG